jgi:hypothetical protein
MSMQAAEIRRRPVWLTVWWARLIAHRREIELAAIDLHERYGFAAYRLARNAARARGGAAHRRHWRAVARRLRRRRFRHAR